MEVSQTDFRQHFELLSDEALLETNPDDLVESARQCFEEEVAKRGLNAGEEAGAVLAENQPEAGAVEPGEEEVLLATFTSGDELNLARGLLESASIPSRVDNPLAVMGGMELRLIVPAAFEEHALEILGAEISDEELAAQAEAAGEHEEPEEEDSGNPGL